MLCLIARADVLRQSILGMLLNIQLLCQSKQHIITFNHSFNDHLGQDRIFKIFDLNTFT